MAKKRSRARSSARKAAPKRKRKTQSSRGLTTKKKTKTTTVSEVNKHLHVVKNPFSNMHQQPKMPDGKVPTSLARRMRNVQSVEVDTGVNFMDILLCPHFGLGCVINGSTEDTTDLGLKWIGFPGQTGGFVCDLFSTGTKPLTPQSGIAKQRIVSQGLRLTQINNDEANDGWFEACRVNFRNTQVNYSLVRQDGTEAVLNSNTGAVLIPDATLMGTLASLPLVEQPGYASGMLKDLKKLEFKNLPVGCECQMNETPTIELTSDTDITIDASGHWAALLATEKAQSAVDMMVDHSWDYVLVRIHGRSGTPNTKLIVELIQNVEFCFDPSSDFVTFQTPNVRHKRIEEEVDKMNNDMDVDGNRRG